MNSGLLSVKNYGDFLCALRGDDRVEDDRKRPKKLNARREMWGN
jgi:hypothetical protein